jgi:CubicO group peptidase (beta-lactamase class C family)
MEPARRSITIRDLLTHRSGLTYGFADGAVAKMYRDSGVSDGIALDDLTAADNASRIARLPLAFQPGTRYNYSLSTDVLGRVIEVASGLPFDRFLEQRIFQPLGMQDTFFWVPDAQTVRIATPYLTDSTGALTLMAEPVTRRDRVAMGGKGSRGSRSFFSGGAGLFGTTGDYARFLQMLLNGGRLDAARILGPKTVALLTATNQLGDLTAKTIDAGVGFSLGFSLVIEPGLTGRPVTAGTFAWGGAYGTSFWVDPKERLVIVLMQQNPTMDRRVRDRFLNLVYQAIEQ